MPRRALVPFPTPILDINLPACAKADCTEYIAAGVACATATAVNACYCNRLTWPTACASACPGRVVVLGSLSVGDGLGARGLWDHAFGDAGFDG
jgi:hypothetical protein